MLQLKTSGVLTVDCKKEIKKLENQKLILRFSTTVVKAYQSDTDEYNDALKNISDEILRRMDKGLKIVHYKEE